MTCSLSAQTMTSDTLAYATIPDSPENYTAATVLARTIDGLGFRYHWATEELRVEDLEYTFSESSRSVSETMDHVFGLCFTISKTILGADKVPATKSPEDTPYTLRAKSLLNLFAASTYLKENPDLNLSEHNIIFSRSDTRSDFPVWNLINGQISDALWHAGQIVSSRRASGNPLDSRVNVFRGKLMSKK